MLENFKQEVERSDEEVRYMHSALLTDSDTGSESNLDVEKGSAILESGQTGDDGPVELALTTSGDPSLIPISAVGNNEILLDTSKNADARTKAENTAPTLTDESSISDVTALDKSTSESSYSETCEDSGAAAEVGLDVDISDSMVDLSLLRRSENSFPESKTSDFSGLELPDGGTPPTLSSLERSTQGEGTETEAAAHLSFDGIINRIDSVKLDSTSELLGVDLFQESTSGESTQTPTHTTPVSDDEGQKENKNSTKVCRLAANIMGDVEKVCMSIPATTASAVTEIKPDYPTVAKVSEDISVSIQDLDHRLEEAAPLPGSGFVSEPALEKSNASNSAEVLNSPDTNGRNVTEDIIMKAIIGSTHAVCSNEGRRANITTDMSTSETSASAGSCSHIDPTIAPGTGAAVYDARLCL
jgi:hypothetical protein